ncbi:DUF5753 domain-containing protein, partial [Micromonospora zhanjiangensis]
VRAMCELYDATAELTTALVALAGETKSKGWWHAYGDLIPDWFELYVGLESTASRLREYEHTLIPGLLQTRRYALAIYQHRIEMTEEERERAADVRLERQALLRRRLPPAPRFEVVLSEAVLLRTIPDRDAMAEQLAHLIKMSQLPNVSLRVLPLARGPHRGAEAGAFVLLEFPIGSRVIPDPPVVYCESWTGALYLDRADEFASYEDIWAGLENDALDEEQSRELIFKIFGEVRRA